MFLQSFHVHRLEEIGELVIGNDLAVEDVDGSCWRGNFEDRVEVEVVVSSVLCQERRTYRRRLIRMLQRARK